MKTYRVHLIRHGLTSGNTKGQYIGRTDLDITADGARMLEQMAAKGEYPYAKVVFSSPLKRCLQTLKIIYPDASPIVVEGLTEYDFGRFEGKTAAELAGDNAFASWISGDIHAAPPDGESTAQFMARCMDSFAKIVEGLMKTGITDAAVCCHGGTIMGILASCGLPQMGFYDWMCGNGRGYTLRITPSVWIRGQKAEVIAEIPAGCDEVDEEQQRLLDQFRNAARGVQKEEPQQGQNP